MKDSNTPLTHQRAAFHNQSGKSLMEMVVVLVLIVIIASFSIAQFRSSAKQVDRQNIARQLKVDFERARFDSVKRRAVDSSSQSKVVVNNTWVSVATDLNQNGVLDGSEQETANFSDNNVTVTGKDMVFPVTVTFDQRGNVIAKGNDGATVNPVFYVCNGSCTYTTLTSANSNIVLVFAAGTVDLLPGNAPTPSFGNPGITQATPTDNIKDSIIISLSASVNLSLTPTPTATSTPTPTPTPTATPTVIPTAVPTATPAACQINEKPSQTGCSCVSPMTTHTNGKCYL